MDLSERIEAQITLLSGLHGVLDDANDALTDAQEALLGAKRALADRESAIMLQHALEGVPTRIDGKRFTREELDAFTNAETEVERTTLEKTQLAVWDHESNVTSARSRVQTARVVLQAMTALLGDQG